MRLDETIKLYNLGRKQEDAGILCHAPFNNLFFGNRGYVMACCFNKLHVLGRYPENTLEEIWNGPEAQILRSAIAKGDLSKGCQGCMSILENGNFGGIPAAVYDKHPVGGLYPTRMEFELDNTCNLECVMCSGEYSSSIRERRERKPAVVSPYDEKFLSQLDAFIPHLHSAQFLGGEPFLIPVYFEIWERLMALNPAIRISVQTNGTILNAKVKRVIENLRVALSVSIDSLDEEAYSKIRVNGDLGRVLANIEYFAQYVKQKQTGMSFSFCPMKQNWAEIPAITAFANKYDASVFFNTVFYPADCSLMNLPATELQEITQYLQQVTLPENTAMEVANKARFAGLIKELKGYQQKAELSKTKPVEYLSFADWLVKMKRYIDSQSGLDAEMKTKVFLNIESKLQFILEKAAEDGIRNEALAGIAGLNIDEIYRSLPEIDSLERVYLLFKERILKIV